MIECEWALLCDYAFPDHKRKMCIIGVFDQITVAAVPSAIQQAALVVKVVGQPDEVVELVLTIMRPSGKQLGRIELRAELGPRGTADLQLGVAGMPLPDFGKYEIQIREGKAEDVIKRLHFTVAEPQV